MQGLGLEVILATLSVAVFFHFCLEVHCKLCFSDIFLQLIFLLYPESSEKDPPHGISHCLGILLSYF